MIGEVWRILARRRWKRLRRRAPRVAIHIMINGNEWRLV
jgi:hypothetical protein